ncbi:IclR family transcriptional regulator [Streptomyces sp. NPDC005122]
MDSPVALEGARDAAAGWSTTPSEHSARVEAGAVQSASPSILSKAFAILETFTQDRGVLSLSQISRSSRLPKSTVHRVIKMLVKLGAVARHGEDYRLGPRMFSFGSRSAEIALREVAMPHLLSLATRTRHLVQLGVLRERDILYLAKVGGQGSLNPVPVGDRLAAHTTALGKAILAFSGEEAVLALADGGLARRTPTTITDHGVLAAALAEVRSRRMATDREEAVRGLHCVAAPILTGGRAVAAISIAFPATLGSGQAFTSALQETATRLSRALQHADTVISRAC